MDEEGSEAQSRSLFLLKGLIPMKKISTILKKILAKAQMSPLLKEAV